MDQAVKAQISTATAKKLARIRNGGKPRVLDLFAGCGGLSLGFQAAGCHVAAGVEIDPPAAWSHAANFFGACHEDHGAHGADRDIRRYEPQDLANDLELGKLETSIDIIVGGPPCQAFARVGRAKLREVSKDPEAFLRDPRSNLYLRYLDYVSAFRPLALLMENVPDALNFGGHNIAEETSEVLAELGYVSAYTLLNSANYGVPQTRERMFLIAYCRELSAAVTFPRPTHWVDLPRGYRGARNVALRHTKATLFDRPSAFVAPPKADPNLPRAVSAQDAIGDLPPITLHLTGQLRRGARRFTDLIPYDSTRPISDYARSMKQWPGFEAGPGLVDHVIRHLPRDWPIFRRMQPGDQYPQAYVHAEELFAEHLETLRAQGTAIEPDGPEYTALRAKMVPPYDTGKFPNKWRKLESDRPARTLMAHLGKDGYSHIHYDSDQARTISVREAARLQSFPDGFQFRGTMNPAFRQIGNAVPPLLARALAIAIYKVVAQEP